MKKLSFILVLLLILFNCSTDEVPLIETADLKAAHGSIIHHASVGSFDYCIAFGENPGCDANFSLVANMYEDGSVSGQYTDVWPGGIGGIHVDIDCLILYDNVAIVGGIIKKGNFLGDDFTGQFAFTALADNGTSNNDPADQISWSWVWPGVENCDDVITLIETYGWSFIEMFEIQGQVRVW